MRIQKDEKGNDVIRFVMGSMGGTWVCDVPKTFLDATKLNKGSHTPAEMVERLEEVAEACDIHHVASRAATHLRKHVAAVPA